MASTANNIGPYRGIRLKQNRKGYWEIWWTDAARGYVTRRESCRSQIDTEAQAYLRAFCDAAREASAVELALRQPTVEDLCVRWIDHAERTGGALKAQTGRKALMAVRRHLGAYTASGLAGRPLLDYAGQRGVSDGTVRRELGALKTVLYWAAKQRLVSRSELPEFELPADGPARTKFLDMAQEARFWDQAMAWGSVKSHGSPAAQRAARDVMVFIALGLETAARRGAIHDLTWDRVDLAQGLIDYRVPGRRVVKKRRVRVPISDRLLPVLQEAWQRAPKDAGGQAVGRVLHSRLLREAFNRFTTSVGMRWVTPHVLRHTYGSLAAMAGVSLWDVSKVMGDTYATVEKHYLHITPGHLRAAVNFRTRSAA